MSQFKKAMLTKYLSQEKEENESSAQSEQEVGSPHNKPENPVSEAHILEEEPPSSPKSTNSLIFDGENWVLSLDSQDLDKEQFNPGITSFPLQG